MYLTKPCQQVAVSLMSLTFTGSSVPPVPHNNENTGTKKKNCLLNYKKPFLFSLLDLRYFKFTSYKWYSLSKLQHYVTIKSNFMFF